VRPSLKDGLIVVLDRYIDSSLAYQGCARGLGIDAVLEVNQRATDGLLPDLTLLLRDDPEGAARRPGGPPDRLEAEGRSLQARVAEGYEELARRYPERIVALDGERPAAAVAADVEAATLAALAAPALFAARSGYGVR
jgi:dTMP kinase